VLTVTTRKHPLALLLMMVIVSATSFLPVQEAKAVLVELAYDNGIQADDFHHNCYGVRFSLPSGVSQARLFTVRFAWTLTGPITGALDIYITGPDHQTLLTPVLHTYAASGGWNDYDVSNLNILVSGDFYVILQDTGNGGSAPVDGSPSVGRSFTGNTLAGLTNPSENLFIRAVINANMPVVGGVLSPVNKLEIVAPFAALTGLLVAVSAVVLVKRRRD